MSEDAEPLAMPHRAWTRSLSIRSAERPPSPPEPGARLEEPNEVPVYLRESSGKTWMLVMAKPAVGVQDGLSSEMESSGAPPPQGDMNAWLRSLDGKLDYITNVVNEMQKNIGTVASVQRKRVSLGVKQSTTSSCLAPAGKKRQATGPDWISEGPGRSAGSADAPRRRATPPNSLGSTCADPVSKIVTRRRGAAGPPGGQGESRERSQEGRAESEEAAREGGPCERTGTVRGREQASTQPVDAPRPSTRSLSSGMSLTSAPRRLFSSRGSAVEKVMTPPKISAPRRTTSKPLTPQNSRFMNLVTGISEDLEQQTRSRSRRASVNVSKLNKQLSGLLVESSERQSKLESIVKHRLFDSAIMYLVVLNALAIGGYTHALALSEGDPRAAGSFLISLLFLDHACTVIFTIELAARVFVFKSDFWQNVRDKYWNLLDTFLVLVGVADALISITIGEYRGQSRYGSGLSMKICKVVRMARFMRILRSLRFVSELRVMVKMIAQSLQSLFWVFVILLMVIYTFSILLTIGATEHLRPQGSMRPKEYAAVKSSFGGIFETMFTLYKSMSGGVDWGEVSSLLREMDDGWLLELVFVGYTFFTIFAVVNIVTGVFVDGAIEIAKRDHVLAMQKRNREQASHEADMVALMHVMGFHDGGAISKDDFTQAMERDEVKEFVSAMQVDVGHAGALFGLLDMHDDGEIDVAEFVEKMAKLRGEAKSVDVAMMMQENRKMLRTVAGLVGMLGESLEAESPEMPTEEDDDE